MPFDFPFHHSGAAARGIYRALLVGAALSVASVAQGAEGKGPGDAGGVQPASPRVNVPVLDIRANIMRRLRQGGQGQGGEPPVPQRSMENGAEPPATETPQSEPAAPAPVEPQEATRPGPAPETGREETRRMAAPESDGAGKSNHVPLPEKTLTIRQLQDVDRLADELDRARRNKENGGR